MREVRVGKINEKKINLIASINRFGVAGILHAFDTEILAYIRWLLFPLEPL